MKLFKEKFISNWQEEFVKPLERELSVSLDSYASLPQGQVTFALIQNPGCGRKRPIPMHKPPCSS